MIPRLGEKYDIEIKVTSKPREEYSTNEYLATNLPPAPAITIDGEVVVKGGNISERKLEAVICRRLGIKESKGFFRRLFKRNQ
jgi:hypothetical protein